jgi:protein disulfide isomerase family A protein 3
MTRLTFALVVALAILPALTLADDVLDLSDQSSTGFKNELAKHETTLVEFFAPWCGHCKRLAPEFTKAATDLKSNDPPVPLVKVDCTTDQGKSLCQENGVSGYPTLKIFKGADVAQDYNGPRDAAGIVKFMRSQVGPASRAYTSFDDLRTRLAAIKDVVVLGVFASESDALAKKFHQTADRLRESVSFAHIYTKDAAGSLSDLAKQVGKSFDSESQVLLVRPPQLSNKFEENVISFDGESDSLNSFVTENYHGLVGHRTQSNIADFKNPLIIAYFDVDYVKNTKGTNYWRNRVLKIAKEFPEINFAISNVHLFAGELEEFGAQPSKDNSPVITARDQQNKKYVLQGKFSVDALQKFAEQFAAGKLQAYIKSEEVPEDNSGPVKVAVAKNFDELVTSSKKDVFIKFYAPWCGHCKKMAPAYEELGTLLKDEPNVEIVKLDATVNDVPEPFVVHGFPTLFFLPADSKTPQKFEGGRDVNDMLSYIAKHATQELKTYNRDGSLRKEEL